MRVPVIYVSAPMRGVKNENRELIFAVGHRLRALGCNPLLPTDIEIIVNRNLEELGLDPPVGLRVGDYMAADLFAICTYADAVVVVGSPQQVEASKGVRAEVAAAEAVGIPVFRKRINPEVRSDFDQYLWGNVVMSFNLFLNNLAFGRVDGIQR